MFQFILTLLIIIIFCYLILKIFLDIFLEKTPFIPTKTETISKLLETLEIQDNDVVYDLGSGDGRFLFQAYQKNPHAYYIGIEKKPLPFFLARLKIILKKNKDKNINQKIQFYRKDLLSINLSSASIIYCYLSPFLLQKLENKFLKELKTGTKIISCDFPLKIKPPLTIIKLDSKSSLNRTIFIYQI